ncbi:MAG: TIGR01212 family radical SAM protein [Spirochaetia bacterium]|jgi:radical SAM protein (TIGR01212 family)|nr:TIGR01212 family radical SAM protein [Spirochaetia bacterium]
MKERPWRTYSSYLKETYGYKVYRVGIDGGFSCPNRDKDRKGGCFFCDATGARAAYQRKEEGKWAAAGNFRNEIASVRPRMQFDLPMRIDSLRQQIESGMHFVRRRYGAERFSLYFQAWTNTYAPVTELKAIYDAALSCGQFLEFIVSTRPDCLEEEVVDLLASYGGIVAQVWVEVGLQSANDVTLSRIHRGHDVDCYVQAVKRLHAKGIKVCTHVINGLPGENTEDYRRTAALVNAVGSEAIKIHNLDIAGGTEFHREYLEGELTVPARRRIMENCIIMLRHLDPRIVVQRMLCETPVHRLVAPRGIGDKEKFLRDLASLMYERGYVQGDLYDEV